MSAVDPFGNVAPNLAGPLTDVAVVVPDNATDLPFVTRALYVGVAGDVAVITQKGTTVTLTALAAGVWHPIRVTRVLLTGTSAGSILAGY